MEPEGVKRRLAAILVADVVDYSRLMHADEEGTLAALRASRRTIEAQLERHGGRIANTAGDSVLAEFGSAVDAVRCAMAVQADMCTGTQDVATGRPMQLRMGLNLGEVIAEGADILGDGVNLAARLQQQAPPGGVLISGTLHDQVAGKVGFGFDDIGEHRVKNFADPIRVYRVLAKGERPTAKGERPTASARAAPAATPHDVSDQDWRTIFLLALFLGWFGAHRFYLHRTRSAAIQLVAFVFSGGITAIWTLLDLIRLWRGTFTDEAGRPIPRTWPGHRANASGQPSGVG